jgi:hypothetical protein
MSARHIVTGKKLIIPPFMPGAFVYGVPGGSSNSVEKMRAFESLYLRPNDGGGGHFVYNISTKQRNSVPRIIGMAGKAIPMTNEIIKTINDQGSDEDQPDGLIFGDIDNLTTILDLEPCEEGEEKYAEFDDDNASDQSYEPKDDDSELSNNHDMPPNQYEQEEVNVEDDNGEDAGVDEAIVDNNNDDHLPPVNEVEQDDDEEDAMLEGLHDEDDPMLEDLHVVEDDDNNEEPADDVPSEKKKGLDRKYWNPNEHAGYCLSVIKRYGNLEATLSTPQYAFKKGLTIFGGLGYGATVKELDENLIGRDVIDMLEPSSVTYCV